MASPNIGLNVTNSGDYSKCCPRRCNIVSKCCLGWWSKPQVDDDKIKEAVEKALSEISHTNSIEIKASPRTYSHHSA